MVTTRTNAPFLAPGEIIRYGFAWPEKKEPRAAYIEVTRIASIRRSGGENRLLAIRTKRQLVNVYISPTGLIRVFKNGKELK